MLYLFIVAWLISPIILTILLLSARSKRKQLEKTLMQLYCQGKVTDADLLLNGLQPPVPPLPQPIYQPPRPEPLPQPAMPQNEAAPDDIPAAATQNQQPADLAAILNMDDAAVAEPDTAPVCEETPADEPVTEAQPATEAEPEAEPAPEPEAEPADSPAPHFRHDEPLPQPWVQQKPPVQQPAFAQSVLPARPKQPPITISAITLMLSVGVVLIVIAGLLFVRSAWESFSGFGKLAALASFSVLFFGASSLSRRVFKLQRTSTAFYSLGAFFLPISVWAAGYFGLLGNGLSGPSNPWLFALAFVAFSITAIIAARLYNHPFWGVAFLSGVSITYLNFASGLSDVILPGDKTAAFSIFLTAASVFGLLLILAARPLKLKLPLAFRSVAEPFSLIYAFAMIFFAGAGIIMSYDTKPADLGSWCFLYGAAAFLTAAGFLAPAATDRMREYSVLPLSLSLLAGFYHTFRPIDDESVYVLMTAITLLLLIISGLLPVPVRKGTIIGTCVLTGISAICMFFNAETALVRTALALVYLLLLAFTAWRTQHKGLAHAAAVQALLFSIGTAPLAVHYLHFTSAEKFLLPAGLFLLFYGLFTLCRPIRTYTADFLFPVSAGICLLCAGDRAAAGEKWIEYTVFAAMTALTLLMWHRALRRDRTDLPAAAHAVLTPVFLFATAIVADYAFFIRQDTQLTTICWSICSVLIGMATYLTTKKRFHRVRRLLFGLTTVPPLAAALFAGIWDDSALVKLQQLICAVAAAALWILFSRRGFRKLSIAGFALTLALTLEATLLALRDFAFDGELPFTAYLITAIWIVALSIVAIAISHRILLFVGNDALAAVMQGAAPVWALGLGYAVCSMSLSDWHPFYFVFGMGLSVLAWLATRREHVLLPLLCSFGLILSVESLRSHCEEPGTGTVFVTLVIACGLTVLFPYLGLVLREDEADPLRNRRAWSLTATGAVIPFWLLAASAGTGYTSYTAAQESWMRFFVPMLLGGYVLHFAAIPKFEKNRREIITVSSLLCMIALWLQPLFEVEDTYFEGKLHLLPLLGFGAVLRHLYGKKTGGNFLFGVGVYSVLRLAVAAMADEAPADLVTVLVVGLAIFVVSFYLKDKKWFLLGGVTLLGIALYMHSRLLDGLQWWAYLLFAGLVLIVLAGMNEMLKAQGESLKDKAGRMWDDWTW